MTTPRQQRAGEPGAPLDLATLFERDYTKIEAVLDFSRGHPYHLITGASAAQRLTLWEDFRGATFAATTSRTGNGYTVTGSGGTNTIAIQSDSTTGHIYAVSAPAVTIANIITLVWGEASVRPMVRAAENPWYKVLIRQSVAPVGGTQDDITGFVGTDSGGIPSGQKDGIYFRRITTGNWFLVCRSTTETTLDMGVAASSTMILLEFRVSLDGGAVSGFYNGRQVGTIRATIPTGLFLICPLHHDNRAAGTTAGACRIDGWGFERDAVA